MGALGPGDEIVVVTRRLEAALPHPLALLGAVDGPQAAWAAPDDDIIMVASGVAHSAVAAGRDRLAQVGRECRAARARVRWHGVLDEAARPRWFGGFAFSATPGDGPWAGFPQALFFLPAAALVQGADGDWLSVARVGASLDELEGEVAELEQRLRAAPARGNGALLTAAQIDHGNLTERVARALARIDSGGAEKVVIATRRTIMMADKPDPAVILVNMANAEPGCFQFLVAPDQGAAIVGASPERLVAMSLDRLRTVALAGSAARGASPEEDRAAAKALIGSAKQREEHNHVVRALRASLADYDVRAPATPRIRRLAKMHHLETPIEALLPERGDVLEAAALLHPTPALAGTPTADALAVIAEVEPEGRGWYGGAVGWTDGRGEGDLAVVIRSVLVQDDAVTAFAGAGIVAASDPDEEVREIDMKLTATLGGAGLGHDAP